MLPYPSAPPRRRTWQPMVLMWKVLPLALAGAGRDITWPVEGTIAQHGDAQWV